MSAPPRFTIHYEVDAFSTQGKLMGRQASGEAFMKAVAVKYPDATLNVMCRNPGLGQSMLNQLRGDGFKGALRLRTALDHVLLSETGAVYTAGPIEPSMAYARNEANPAAYSLIGITHTLCSSGAMDMIGQMAHAPFQPWDALICTSQAAKVVVERLNQEARDWSAEHLGATKFNTPQLPVIPLGVDTAAKARTPDGIAAARQAFGLEPDDLVFMFAGRLSFNGKANPVAFYQAAELLAQRHGSRIVCIEAGLYFNPAIAKVFEAAREALAPSVTFIWADGADSQAYADAWNAADVFVSLSDNIQETFGLTPVEAMAAGIPVIVSDWDGYKDTVRDGVDGFRIPVLLPPVGAAKYLARRYAGGLDNYDFYVARVSMATAVDSAVLLERMTLLAQDGDLRRRMGDAGQARARAQFDWSHILDRFNDLADDLARLRPTTTAATQAWRLRPDPFTLFRGFGSDTLSGAWRVTPVEGREDALKGLLELVIVNYALGPGLTTAEELERVLRHGQDGLTVGELIVAAGGGSPSRVAALMMLYKLDLVRLAPPDNGQITVA